MRERQEVGRSNAVRVRSLSVLVACGVVLVAAGTGVALANDMAGFASGLGAAVALGILIIFIVSVGYIIAVVLIETAVLRQFVELGYRRAFGYILLANLASAAVGLVWYLVAGNEGWKTAWYERAGGPEVALLFLRSFLVTAVAEALVLKALLAEDAAPRIVAAVAVAGNAMTYGLAALLMAWLPL